MKRIVGVLIIGFLFAFVLKESLHAGSEFRELTQSELRQLAGKEDECTNCRNLSSIVGYSSMCQVYHKLNFSDCIPDGPPGTCPRRYSSTRLALQIVYGPGQAAVTNTPGFYCEVPTVPNYNCCGYIDHENYGGGFLCQ